MSLLNRFTARLVEASQEPRSAGAKALALLLWGTLFFIVVPVLLFGAGYLIERRILSQWAGLLQTAFAGVCIAVGLLLAAWTVLTQVTRGKGTPVPLLPTQKLIVTGPYKLCRNPMQLGAMIYYLGIGTWFGSISIGALMFLIGLVLGSCYHKFVEEKELLLRFGQEYEQYRRKTPFLIPKL